MQLNTFMTTLMPSFTKDTVLEEFEDVQKQINNINLPLFAQALKELSRYKFRSDLTERMDESLYDNVKVKKHPNFIGAFNDITKRMRDQLPILEKLIDDHFEVDISSSAMTLHRINILQYIPVMSFVLRYQRAFMNYAVSMEVNAESESTEPVFDLIPADRDWLARHRDAFIDSVAVVYNRGSNLEKTFEALPDMAIDPQNAKTVEQTKASVIDPLGMKFIPLTINPVFHFRKMLTNYQVERYQLAKAEYDMLQRKLYNLRIINEGRNDAKLQREIKYTEEQRVRPLSQKIQKWEQDYVANA